VNSKETIFLIATFVTIVAVILPIVLDIWEPLKKYPKFEVELEAPQDSQNPIARLTIKNVGDIQAKNAVVYVMSEEPVQISNLVCPEGKIQYENQQFPEIEFKKLSTNFECILDLVSEEDGLIFNVAISADDMMGFNLPIDPPLNFTRYEDDQLVEQLQLLKEQFRTLNELREIQEKQKNQIDFALISASIGIASTLFGLFNLFRRKTITFEINEKRFQVNTKDRETEIITELKENDEKLKEINKSIEARDETRIPSHLSKKQEFFIKKMFQLSNERNRLLSTMSAKITTRTLIGEFFELWVELEKDLIETIQKISDKPILPTNIIKILDTLENKKILEKSIINELHTIRKFRNQLIHGEIQPDVDELNNKNSQLKKVLQQIIDMRIPITHQVSIPPGTSVPGCEETGECFIPSVLTLRQNGLVIWNNDDTAAHTITSGNPGSGADGKFDSGLFMQGGSFAHEFTESGEHPYFCLVHPWQTGKIIVKK